MFGQAALDVRQAIPGERYYYIEVAIGNMAWHWIKVGIYEVEGKLTAELLRLAIS